MVGSNFVSWWFWQWSGQLWWRGYTFVVMQTLWKSVTQRAVDLKGMDEFIFCNCLRRIFCHVSVRLQKQSLPVGKPGCKSLSQYHCHWFVNNIVHLWQKCYQYYLAEHRISFGNNFWIILESLDVGMLFLTELILQWWNPGLDCISGRALKLLIVDRRCQILPLTGV